MLVSRGVGVDSVFDGRFVFLFTDVNLTLIQNAVISIFANNDVVVTSFRNLIHDVGEDDHITFGDISVLLHHEIEINVSTFVSNSTLEESGFSILDGLLV